jgi:hypothetical protein
MTDVFKGAAAGFVAMGVLTGLLIAQRVLGLFPELDLVALTSAVVGSRGDRVVGWIVLVTVGAVAGGALFAIVEPRLGANTTMKRGLLFGMLAWLAQMLIFMPAANAGLFGLRLGPATPILLLLANAIYGVVLGRVYATMMPTPSLESRHSRHGAA